MSIAELCLPSFCGLSLLIIAAALAAGMYEIFASIAERINKYGGDEHGKKNTRNPKPLTEESG